MVTSFLFCLTVLEGLFGVLEIVFEVLLVLPVLGGLFGVFLFPSFSCLLGVWVVSVLVSLWCLCGVCVLCAVLSSTLCFVASLVFT